MDDVADAWLARVLHVSPADFGSGDDTPPADAPPAAAPAPEAPVAPMVPAGDAAPVPVSFGITTPPVDVLDPNAIQKLYGPSASRVSAYLQDHHLMRAGKLVMLDVTSMSVADATKKVIAALNLPFDQATVQPWVQDAADAAPDFWQAPPPPGTKPASGPAPQYSLTYAIVPITGHVAAGGATSSDGVQQQISPTVTFALHPDGVAGPELSWTAQVALSGSDFTVQNILSGGQAAWVIPFLDGALQVSALAQALAGVAKGGPAAKGTIALVPSGQIAAGGQVTYAIPGTSKHVLIGFQLAGSITTTQGQNATLDAAPQGFIQVQWN